VETALTRIPHRYVVATIGALMIGLIAGLALTGIRPGLPKLHFEGHGIIATPPSAIVRAEIRIGAEHLGFIRSKWAPWAFDRPGATEVPGELASHLETALQFMHVSEPFRTLDQNEYQGASFADFGLDPPAYLISLAPDDHAPIVADFGALNPANTSQYVRLVGQSRLYLLPRHVGGEWQLTADIAKRILPPDPEGKSEAMARAKSSTGFLLPASLDQIWVIEIVFQGKLNRFERDGAGNWFSHVGQHAHSGNSNAHVADPVQAKVIATALAAFEQTQVETVVGRHADPGQLEQYGLALPKLIALFYPRDSSSPVARIEIGNMAADGFGRYARVAESGDVVTIAAYEAARLVELLKAVGVAS
jgi:hypothetical protein